MTTSTADAHGAAPAAGLTIHTASQVEDLLDPLVERLRDPALRPADPFVPITVMVQSIGMQRWLSHHIAERLDEHGRGIATTLEFTFPGKVVERIVAACLDDAPDGDPWANDRLPWPLLAAIRAHADHPSLQRLTQYLGGEQALRAAVIDRRAWRFARNVADVFDRYVLHRSEMVTRWAAGDDVDPDGTPLDERDAWQPHLWRALVDHLGDPTERLSRAIEELRTTAPGAVPDADLPGFLAVEDGLPLPLVTFGISALPPRQLELIAALAHRNEVVLFLPTASTVRWETIAAATADGHDAPEPQHPLLVSCGALLDDAAHLLLAAQPRWTAHTPPSAGDPPAAPSLLHHAQAAIRADAAPVADHHLDVAAGRATDTSVQIHACHGPARQAEVLRDVLLGLFADDPTLQPRDVLVMTPDIDGYAPLVQAAFAATDHVPEVPVSVADRQVGRTNPVADVLLAALDLGTGRVTATQVLDLLGRDAVLARFGLSLDDLGTVAGWVDATGIRWGIDDAHRASHGQPADRAHTWRFGLDRLLLGAAMTDEGHRVVGDVAPFDDVEGGDVEVAGRVADACATLFRFVEEAKEPTDVDGWVARCTTLLRDLVAVPHTERWRVQEVRAQLEGLRGLDHGEPLRLDLPAARAVVEASLAGARGAAGYETGAVTLCALVPMRSIPHRVVVLLGMDDGQLPRSNLRLGFDLQDRFPARGDRDRRGEDRSLFLEAVLAARQHLIVTTTGQDVRTGEERPPAVPLAELLDVLDATATVEGGRAVRDVITRTHPLQAFSPRNFGDDGADEVLAPFGFDPVARDAAERVRDPRRRRPVLFTSPLPPPAADPDDVDAPDLAVVRLEDLASALYHPTELLLTRRLGIGLREFTTEVDDLEPITLAPLTAAGLGRALIRSPAGLGSPDRWRAATLATGAAPAGTPGQVSLSDLSDEVGHVLAAAAARVGATGATHDALATLTEGERRSLDVVVGDRRLVGEVDGIHADGADGGVIRLFLGYVRPRPEQLLRAWVAHLALTAAGMTALDTWVVTRGSSGARHPVKERHLGPLTEDPDEAIHLANDLLGELVAVHDRAWCELLPLFPRSSHAFADKGDMGSARTAFEPSYWALGDVGDLDEATVHVYGDEVGLEDVLDLIGGDDAREEFARLAELVWGRVLAHEGASTP